jgi:hypothetical protein
MHNASQTLEPLPYHVELRDYLKGQEADLWKWFASAQAQSDYTEHLRLELLKSAYRLDAASHGDLFRAAEEAKEVLQLDLPLTLYQLQNSTHLNAALYYIPGEAHIVLSGPVLALLDFHELKSLLGHELAHYHLWQIDGGEFHIADRLINAVANDPRASASHHQSARWFQLYTEIFADRGSFLVTRDIQPVVSGLVKMQTGITHASAESYLKQADEIFARSKVKTAEVTHPEAFIRARALSLWAQQNSDTSGQIGAMIEGSAVFDELDLIQQMRLSSLTRRFLEAFLHPKWFQTDPVLAHAKLFFDDFRPAKSKTALSRDELQTHDNRLREYFCYLLLDFIAADPELDEMPLAAALEFAKSLELETILEKLLTKELHLKARDLKRVKEEAASMLEKAEASR